MFTCILCGNHTYEKLRDHIRDNDKQAVYRCEQCGLEQLFPLPSEKEDEAFYESNRMHTTLIPDWNEKMIAKYRPWADYQSKWVEESISTNNRIFEIGSGYGCLLEKLKADGYDIVGSDLSLEKCRLIEKKCGVPAYHLNLIKETPPALLHGKFDAVIGFHVLEHISKPLAFVKNAQKLLRPGGQIMFELPNVNCAFKKACPAYGDFQYWQGHLAYYCDKTLSRLMTDAGLENVRISYYQLYGLENVFYWLEHGKPVLEKCQFDIVPDLQWLQDYYKQRLAVEGATDCIRVLANTSCRHDDGV